MFIVVSHRPFWEPKFRTQVTACHDLEDAEQCFIQLTAQAFEDRRVDLPEPLTDYAQACGQLDRYREEREVDEQHLIYEIGSAPDKGVMPELPYLGQPGEDCSDLTDGELAEHFADQMMEAVDDFRRNFCDKMNIRDPTRHAVENWLKDRCNPSIDPAFLLKQNFYFLCAFHPHAVKRMYERPITINGRDTNGNNQSFTPDFLVEFQTTTREIKRCLVEVKPKVALENADAALQERLNMAKRWAAENDYMFEVVTESHMNDVAPSNAVEVLPFIFGNLNTSLYLIIQIEVSKSPGLTVGDLADQLVNLHDLNIPRDYVLNQIWITLAYSAVHFDISKPLSSDTALFEDPVRSNANLFFLEGW